MKISRALLKFGYSKFSLLILEYCETDDLLKREQYYLDLLQPEYNILKIAGSRLGAVHSEETKQKISEALLGEKHPLYGLKGKKSHMFGKTQSEETKLKKSRVLGKTIYFYSLNLELLSTFTSSKVAAKYLNSSDPTIMKYARSEALFEDERSSSSKEKSVFEKTEELISKNMSEVSTSSSCAAFYVYSLENQLLNTFSSSKAAARYFQAGNGTIMKYARSGEVLKEKYILSLEKLPSSPDLS